MSLAFVWAIVVVIALLAGPFAALRLASHYRIRMSAAAEKRQAEMAAREKDETASGDKPRGFW